MTNKSLINGKLLLIIQCMIENALLHSILDTISKQIKQPWEYFQEDNLFDPLRGLRESRNGRVYKKTKWITQMNGLPNNGQMKR
jgi:hypothetical protein